MKITEKQLMILFETTKETLNTHDAAGLFSYTRETRFNVIKEIINQQSDEIKEVE